ncbi:cytochrome c1 [Alphaproteobacteria bacterium]|nr:cytochrome c1 [Alphaproteobacteria bacterium]
MKIVFLALLISSYLTKFLFSATEATKPVQYDFSFKGILGTIDKKSAQRGLQVFTEVCASCHGLKHLAYRNLEDLGYNKSQINNIAKQYLVDDLPDENGEIKKRNAIYSDNFVDPYPNEKTAKAFNNGAYPPDLTLMVKARKDGANYLRSLLLGYEDTPEGLDVGEGYYNKYMPGNIIAMPQPLYGEDVEYQDGTIPTLEQEVLDVVTFLTWTAMPELEKRKSSGIKVIIFLIIMTFFFFLSYKKIWKDVK